MMGSSWGLLCFLGLCLTVLIPTSCRSHILLPENHVALFVLGDSLYDAGINNYINTTAEFRANFYPYGETFFHYPTGRFSNGRLIPDFIAEYAGLPLITPYLQPGFENQAVNGLNFASGGGGALAESHQGFVVDLHMQLKYFENVVKLLREKLGNAQAKRLLSTAVYMISIGGNDYLARSPVFQSFSDQDYVDLVLGNFTNVIKGIYKKGGRKFGFGKLFPLGCVPSLRKDNLENGGDCVEDANSISKLHNSALSKTLKNLTHQLHGFKYSLFDFYTSSQEVLQNPSKFGFKNWDTACCGSGPFNGNYSCGGQRGETEYELCKNTSEYVFFDAFHPTETFYKHISKLMWSGSTNINAPFNLKALFQHV